MAAVEIVAHDPRWADTFALEVKVLRDTLGDKLLDIHHIGSTAIPAIYAKPVIDILGVASSLDAVDAAKDQMQAIGYNPLGENGIAGRRYFQKFNADSVRTHHFHIFEARAPEIERHLAFRDYLLAYPDKAASYSALKVEILYARPESREAYQEAKDPFITRMIGEAVDWYRA
jgi:GrpB-like predicted nucleotidyltransferase (UPF0157 family)